MQQQEHAPRNNPDPDPAGAQLKKAAVQIVTGGLLAVALLIVVQMHLEGEGIGIILASGIAAGGWVTFLVGPETLTE